MDTDRRSFLKGIFSGVMVAGIAGVGSQVTIYHEHEHYTGMLGKHNIWYVQDEFWHLLSDSHRAPFEFASAEAAYDYINATGLQRYNDNYREKNVNKNGLVRIQRIPTAIHDMTTLRQSTAEISTFIHENGITDPIHRQIIFDILSAQNGLEQSRKWIDILEIKSNRSSILELQHCKPFGKVLRTIYCGDRNGDTYHSLLAKLECFTPSRTFSWV